jgi:short-subunit dehydrogenase
MTAVLITGGSCGIGLAFAEYYASQGCDLILAARKMPRLIDAKTEIQNQYCVKVDTVSIDLSVTGSAQQLYDRLQGRQIDILINNAGVGYTAVSWKNDIDSDERMAVLNDVAMMSLTKLYLHDMVSRKEGTIINVASTGAFQPGPYIAGYYASKSFVYSYTRAVHEEVSRLGVSVYCLCPGPVNTEFYQNSGLNAPGTAMSPEKCVAYAVSHMKNKCVIIPGFWNRAAWLLPVSMRMESVKKMKRNTLHKQYREEHRK